MKVKGKTIIVTGAASGIGKELTKLLIQMEAKVIGADINADALATLKKEIASPNLATYVLDMGNKEAIRSFVSNDLKKHAPVHGVINNAGIIHPFLTVEKLDDKIINKVMDINFFGPLELTKLLIPEFLKLKEEAHIVNVSSMGGFFPFPGQTVYGASKAALKIFTEGLYGELLDTNVRVTAVFPGAVATNITANSNLKEKEEKDEGSGMKALPADDAAMMIVRAMEKNKFKVYVGNDAKFMNLFYKFNDKKAIKFIKKKMKDLF